MGYDLDTRRQTLEAGEAMRLGYYREDGARILVEVLSDVTTDDWRKIKVRAIRQERGSHLMPDTEPGEEWEASARANVCCPGMWDLELLSNPNGEET